MFIVQIESWFESAHSLRNYEGKCKNIHGHNFKVVVSFKSEQLDERGMVIDFLDAERELKKITDRLDHKYLNEVAPFDQINPTVELLAKYIYDELRTAFPGVMVDKVMVYETEQFVATYRED
ncbi:MAG: 6-carboxytetrahydropterin synthase QueD [Calditrichia bacterium]